MSQQNGVVMTRYEFKCALAKLAGWKRKRHGWAQGKTKWADERFWGCVPDYPDNIALAFELIDIIKELDPGQREAQQIFKKWFSGVTFANVVLNVTPAAIAEDISRAFYRAVTGTEVSIQKRQASTRAKKS